MTEPVDTIALALLAEAALETWKHAPGRWEIWAEELCAYYEADSEDAAFIAAASPEVVLALIAELQELRAGGDRLDAVVGEGESA